MTVVAIMAGLMAILWNTGTGSEAMQRIAVPMVGGMISSTVLTLLVIPAFSSRTWPSSTSTELRAAGVRAEEVSLAIAA